MALDVKGTEKDQVANPHNLEELYSKKSSLSCSSRMSYYRSPEGVPFQWEKQPGKAIDPPKEDILLPLSPPPAVLSLRLPIPNISIQEPNKKTSLLLKFWKRIKKSHQGKEAQDSVNKRVECYSSDGEFMASPRINSSCSSLSSVSFYNDQTRQMGLDGSIGGSMRRPFGCGVMSFPSILVAFTKRP